jgi:hypothetical protein
VEGIWPLGLSRYFSRKRDQADEHRKRKFELEENFEIEFEKNGLKNLVLKEQVKPDKKG